MNNLLASEGIITNLRRFMFAKGWQIIEHPNTRIEVLESKSDAAGDFATVSIPRSPELKGATELINEAVRLIAEFESIATEKIVNQIIRWDRDILRSRLFKIHGNENTLPLGVAANTITRIKEFLGYAAYTHTNPRPFFDKAGAISGVFADHCLFGHTFEGSFGLTVECPIQVIPDLNLAGVEPVVPMESQVIERIANGLITLRESILKESIDPMIAGYLTGFSANMCRKIAEIYEEADGRRIEYDISWSPQLKTTFESSWKPMTFDGRAYDFARSAAVELEKAEEFPDSQVEGRIVVLKSDMPPGLDDQAEFEHIITMFWERQKGQSVKIRVPLSPQQYIDACVAHKDGRAIRVFGIPEKAGKYWALTKPHDFVVLR